MLRDFANTFTNNVTVNVSARLSMNFALEVAGVTQEVEVTTSSDSPLLASTASVGGVINGKEIHDLPLPDRDALGLVLTQPGVIGRQFRRRSNRSPERNARRYQCDGSAH